MLNKRDVSRSRTPTDTERKYQLDSIPNKVDKEKGKGLSSNDFTNNYKNQIEVNSKNRHNHNNMSILNSISQDTLDGINLIIKQPQLYVLFEGNSKKIELLDNPINYDMMAVIYGNDTFSAVKWIFAANDMQFYISLDIDQNNAEKSLCSILGTTLISDSLNIQKVIAFKFRKGVVVNGSN